MSLRSALTRVAIAGAAGTLATVAAVTPAAADNDWGNGSGGNSSGAAQQDGNHWGNTSGSNNSGTAQQDGNHWGNTSGSNNSGATQQDGGDGRGEWGGDHHGGHDDQRLYRGVVTADTLLLRSAPNRGSRVIRTAHRGQVVSIFCKTPGQKVHGNPLWYLLTDGTWAWGSAAYIDNLGPAPRWC
ncbi:SH3 domain-containing protein [Streptomyces sp. MUM 2J]|uniref:SH3 domain-containing protein n=1 Tax=Streptomyces sp. MUM 2J TaxID=2791987 RepID=UPI001F049571|nr:SH3 domain-containing protein [Streptomyces sp. MUM 2J]MCH0566646.1 SH3 domain-containing protein [Streptomyces sp. MUM 2J]